MTEFEAREQVIDVCRRMYRQGTIAAADGNVSVRLGRDRLLVTPSGLPKGELGTQDLVTVDLAGKRLGGRRQASSEIRLHLAVYGARPDVQAIVHAHPPYTVALTLAGVSLTDCVLPEVALALGPVPTAPYATPTTAEVPASILPLLPGARALVLCRHGSLTLGASLEEAYQRLEALEHAARILHAAHLLGPLRPLSPEEERRLQAVAARAGS
jgi:L-fuculose-phosphate aldolase